MNYPEKTKRITYSATFSSGTKKIFRQPDFKSAWNMASKWENTHGHIMKLGIKETKKQIEESRKQAIALYREQAITC